LLIEAIVDPYLKEVIAGAPSTLGFLGVGNEPTPLRPDEVNRILGKIDETAAAGEQPEIPFKNGDPVKVVDGPFNNFTGVVEEVFPDKMKVRVMVSIFGRRTPLELDYLQVEHEQ
jgi:transcriptional antiterminator NusG